MCQNEQVIQYKFLGLNLHKQYAFASVQDLNVQCFHASRQLSALRHIVEVSWLSCILQRTGAIVHLQKIVEAQHWGNLTGIKELNSERCDRGQQKTLSEGTW